MPFFSSLTHSGSRVGGQRERQFQAFEAGAAYFPRDYPTSAAYETEVQRRGSEEEETWNKKPPAKRPNFEKLGTRSPWLADWKVILGLEVEKGQISSQSDSDFLPTQRDDSMIIDQPQSDPDVKPWLLRGAHAPHIAVELSRSLDAKAALMETINSFRAKRGLNFLNTANRDDLARGALITVQLRMVNQGAPDDMSMLYKMPDREIQVVLGRMSIKNIADHNKQVICSEGRLFRQFGSPFIRRNMVPSLRQRR